MNSLFALLLLGFPLQDDFGMFSFCRDALGGAHQVQCVELDASGRGRFAVQSAEDDSLDVPLELSPFGTSRFRKLLADTDYLEDAETYDSGRNVVSLGLKTLILDGPTGRREARFYASTRREVMSLASFLDRLIAQETLLLDIESALQFDPLGIPGWLDFIEQDLNRNRLADAPGLIPLLARIAADDRVVNYARTTAKRLQDRIENGSD